MKTQKLFSCLFILRDEIFFNKLIIYPTRMIGFRKAISSKILLTKFFQLQIILCIFP